VNESFLGGLIVGLFSGLFIVVVMAWFLVMVPMIQRLHDARSQEDNWRNWARTFGREANKLAEKHGEGKVVGDGFFENDRIF
jgi:uncharacterized membrane protein